VKSAAFWFRGAAIAVGARKQRGKRSTGRLEMTTFSFERSLWKKAEVALSAEDIQPMQEEIVHLREENEKLLWCSRKDFEFYAEICTLNYQLKAAVRREWKSVLRWRYVVLIAVIEAVRLGIDLSRLGH
jgi:hypothetical protein